MRILVHPLFRLIYPHLLEYLHRLHPRRFILFILMLHNSFRYLIPYRKHRIKARHRLLKYHRDLITAYLPHTLLRRLQQFLPLKFNTPLDYPSRRHRYQPHYR